MLNDAIYAHIKAAAMALGAPLGVLMIVAGLFAPVLLLALLPALVIFWAAGPALLRRAGVVLTHAPEIVARLFSFIFAAWTIPSVPKYLITQCSPGAHLRANPRRPGAPSAQAV